MLSGPSLHTVQNSQDNYLFFASDVDCDERQRREGHLSRPLDATRPSEVWERFQCSDALDYGVRHALCGFRTAFRNVVADTFEIIRGICRPADAHQSR
jgi:hypothetical protein